jgi:NADPH:quinone reductase-like Zn-dependent oxidoreductase
MKAIVYHEYGSPDVLRYEEIERPTPGSHDVLIAVRAASVNPADWHFMRGTPYFLRAMTGVRKPRVTRLGMDVAGRVEAVGSDVTRFKAGDAVFGGCQGAFADYVSAPESRLTIKPERVTFEQAASAPVAALTALQSLRDKGRIRPGQTVLINGAAGGVGTFAVQIARSFGASVTGVCSTRNVDLVGGIGADRVIDYTREDFTTDGARYDTILDCVGNQPLSACRRVLKRGGTYVAVAGPSGRWMLGALARMVTAVLVSPVGRKKMTMLVAKLGHEDLAIAGALMAAGTVTPVIDRRYSLSETAAAIRYLEEGHARGKVIITVGGDATA